VANANKQVDSELDTRISVGDVLSVLFDIKSGNLREAFYIDGKQPLKLATGADVWNFDLKKLCTPAPSNLVIAYSRTHYENDDTTSADKSSLYYENNIIISSVKVDDKRWRINVLIPNFRNADYKKPGDRLNIPSSASFIVGSDNIAPIKLGKKKKFYFSLKEGMDQSHALKSDARVLESLILLQRMHQAVSQKLDSELSDEKLTKLHADMLFEIGFHLTELNQPTKALSYLSASMKKVPSMDTMYEYISILSNIVDPRCMDIVKSEIDKHPTDHSYANFLDRRYAYLLIEYGKLDEAKVILQRMLKVPGNESFVRKELDYIESLRKAE
jgi:hypothetical protein